MIKVLAIGNSFSQDATALIDFLTEDIFARTVAYSGCSLQQHCEYGKKDTKIYEYHHNGADSLPQRVSLAEALAFEKWDYVTVQQVSGWAGLEETFTPYIDELIAFIRERSDAKILFHQTWPYQADTGHADFARYHRDRKEMWEMIRQTSEKICLERSIPIIKTGEIIYKLGETDTFNPSMGGLSLYRDSFHMNANYGRFVAACVWIKFFTGKLPKYLLKDNLEKPYQLIKEYLMEK